MVKKVITTLYKSLFYAATAKKFRALLKRDFFNENEKSKFQHEKLSLILKTAINKVPLYKNLNFDYENFSYVDFQKIPVLTKDIIRKESYLLINNDYKKINEVFKNTSGGSTGEPVTFYQTKEQMQYGTANYFLALHCNGVNINDSSVDLWGATRDMHISNPKFNIRTLLHNTVTLNTFVMSEIIMQEYIMRLNIIKPRFIKAYVHSIYDLAKFINRNKIKINFKPVIHCTTGPLYPEMREEIKKAFNNTYVYNFYGSREVSAIATEVRKYSGMYILYDNVFVEILDKNNKPVLKGEEGTIVVTTLNNFYMPLLRYNIGDRAIKGDDISFGTLKLDSVIGRTLGVIHKKDGTKIDGQFFTTLFFNKKSIISFQLIQKTITSLELNIVKSESYRTKDLNTIMNKIRIELGEVDIQINFCDKINLTKTGKLMYVYSELEN